MRGEERRRAIMLALEKADKQISATALAKEFGVSRQIIVGDVAILRAQGVEITALARGYVIEKKPSTERVFKVHHSDADTEKELNIFVDSGACVVDIFVSHETYGKLRADMNIKSRVDVQRFLEQIASGKSSLLKNVTAGYHYHTVRAESEDILDIVEKRLEENGFLAPSQND